MIRIVLPRQFVFRLNIIELILSLFMREVLMQTRNRTNQYPNAYKMGVSPGNA